MSKLLDFLNKFEDDKFLHCACMLKSNEYHSTLVVLEHSREINAKVCKNVKNLDCLTISFSHLCIAK